MRPAPSQAKPTPSHSRVPRSLCAKTSTSMRLNFVLSFIATSPCSAECAGYRRKRRNGTRVSQHESSKKNANCR